MSDIKLFKFSNGRVNEIEGRSVILEKSLQNTIEKHLEDFFGVRFLASEYSTGKTHGGRIDTLGIDENGCPVIIEYKRAINENVINQGLFYLNWLVDHKGEFELLVWKTLSKEISEQIEWLNPRLICIAGDFKKYDEHAVHQMNRNIELVRYRSYGDELILFELVNAASVEAEEQVSIKPSTRTKSSDKTVTEYLSQSDEVLKDIFESVKLFILALGDDIQMKTLKNYIAFRRFRNFACVEVHPQSKKVLVFVKVNPDEVKLVDGFTRDVREIGHFGTGDLEITLKSQSDFEKAKDLIIQSYESS